MKPASTHEQIVSAADGLFYRRGFQNTSFADIAEAVRISRGNFYYHFKTKDDILDAVIRARAAATRDMIATWEAAAPTPLERVRCYIHILLTNRAGIKRFGCPVGTLCGELAKLGHPAVKDANGIFRLFRVWLAEQFAALGRTRDADALAMHVLAQSQGIATLYNAGRDEAFLKREVAALDAWLDDIAPKPSRKRSKS